MKGLVIRSDTPQGAIAEIVYRMDNDLSRWEREASGYSPEGQNIMRVKMNLMYELRNILSAATFDSGKEE